MIYLLTMYDIRILNVCFMYLYVYEIDNLINCKVIGYKLCFLKCVFKNINFIGYQQMLFIKSLKIKYVWVIVIEVFQVLKWIVIFLEGYKLVVFFKYI